MNIEIVYRIIRLLVKVEQSSAAYTQGHDFFLEPITITQPPLLLTSDI